jgi:hypothetical protein
VLCSCRVAYHGLGLLPSSTDVARRSRSEPKDRTEGQGTEGQCETKAVQLQRFRSRRTRRLSLAHLQRSNSNFQDWRAGRWPTDKSLAARLDADPRAIRRDLEYVRCRLHTPIAWSRVHLLIFRAVLGVGGCHVLLRFRSDVARRFAEEQWHASQVLELQTDGTLIKQTQVSSLVETELWGMC